MKENKTLAELYQKGSQHKFGDISLQIENQGGQLQGKFIFHPIDADQNGIQKKLLASDLPGCFGDPPTTINSDVEAETVWDKNYRTFGDVIPQVEKEIEKYSEALENIGSRLVDCAKCPVFDRCYRIAELNLQKRRFGVKVNNKWSL